MQIFILKRYEKFNKKNAFGKFIGKKQKPRVDAD